MTKTLTAWHEKLQTHLTTLLSVPCASKLVKKSSHNGAIKDTKISTISWILLRQRRNVNFHSLQRLSAARVVDQFGCKKKNYWMDFHKTTRSEIYTIHRNRTWLQESGRNIYKINNTSLKEEILWNKCGDTFRFYSFSEWISYNLKLET